MRWLTKREREKKYEGRHWFTTWFAWYPVKLNNRPEQWVWLEKVSVTNSYHRSCYTGILHREYQYYGL
jgi:hypothetical protein